MISRILYANNRNCNLLAAFIGIFLHTCNAPERVIDVLWRMNTSISVGSINNAINSLSEEAAKHIRAAGKTFLYGYVLDNFDVQLKHKAPTVEQSRDTLFHLISGALVKLAHASTDSLKYSSYLWERSRLNDLRTLPLPHLSVDMLFQLHPDTTDTYNMDRRERFNAWKFMVTLCTYGPKYFRQFLPSIKAPENVERIPPVKTTQVPAQSMRFNNSSVGGNINAIEDLLRQGGVEDSEDYVILFHGDVGTGERVRSAQLYRSIERTAQRRMQYLIFVPGLFHTEMACAEALHRMFLESKPGHSDDSSFYSYVTILFPNDSNNIANNKCSFQKLSDSILRTATADQLECWRAYSQSVSPDCDTLDKFANRSPSLQDLWRISRTLSQTYNSTSKDFKRERRKPLKERDQIYKNAIARVDYFLLYEETIYSMRHGDVGRLETCLRKWILVFRGTGKHKYARMLSEFMLDVHYVYPEALRKVIRYNWLCNPLGTSDGFRGVDWLLELNNLLTKVIYGGKSSNYTIERIIKESTLIQLYRDCKKVVEDQFLITPKTMRHGEPDFTETYRVMSRKAIRDSFLIKKPGRSSAHPIPDVLAIGMAKYQSDLSAVSTEMGVETDELIPYEITATEDEVYLVS